MSTDPPLKSHRGEGAESNVVRVGSVTFGDGSFPVIAGPCAVESEEQVHQTAELVASRGAAMLRGGVFKPRTSPYTFQGLGPAGLRMLEEAGRLNGLPIVTEVMEPEMVEEIAEHADMLQVGSRNMQNFPLLRAVGKVRRPVMLKRGMSATIDEWLLAAEYILNEGNDQVVMCERGIRTFETRTRNTFDVSAVPVVKRVGRLPVIVDPSHASGDRSLILPLTLAGRAVGADGVMVEVHPYPADALSDGPQQLDAEGFSELMDGLGLASRRAEIDRLDREIIGLLGRRVARSVAIGRFKAAQGHPLRAPDREDEILEALNAEAERSGLSGPQVRRIYELVLEISRHEQQRAVDEGAAAPQAGKHPGA